MAYTDIGFDEFLQRSDAPMQGQPNGGQLDPLEADTYLPEVSGSKITGGIISSPDGRLKINLDEGFLKISDGVQDDLARFGILPDGSVGLMVRDNEGNILMQVSSKQMLLQSADKSMSIDLILAQVILRELGVPIFLLGKKEKAF